MTFEYPRSFLANSILKIVYLLSLREFIEILRRIIHSICVITPYFRLVLYVFSARYLDIVYLFIVNLSFY